MKIFEVQTELKSYSYPVVKIIISVLIMLLYFWRNDLFGPFNKVMAVVITILGFVFMTLSILCIYISIGELFCVYENRSPEKKVDEKDTKLVTMDYILKIVDDNDIIDIEVYSKGHVISVGASSNCKNSNNVFYDKLFYVHKENYETLELFREAIKVYSDNGFLYVVSIDGMRLV